MSKIHSKKGFTLVELIVVIVIIAILATIAFISFSSQTSSARDSVRLADIGNIAEGVVLYNATSGIYPKPDKEFITISASGSVIGYQGYAGKSVMGIARLSANGGKDPLDSSYYTYSINSKQNKFQLLIFLENGNNVNLSFLPDILAFQKSGADVNDYSHRYPVTKGDQLGMILFSGSSLPVQSKYELAAFTGIDVYSDTGSYRIQFSTKDQIMASGSTLIQLVYSFPDGRGYQNRLNCPEGFISVPENKTLNQQTFCVMKYEAKPASTGGLLQDATYLAWNYSSGMSIKSAPSPQAINLVTQAQAISACSSMGTGYHLITENEWMTLARNIESNPLNWVSLNIGNGSMYKGHSDSFPLFTLNAGTDDSDGYYMTQNSSSSGAEQRRTFILTNGEVIWDLSGNLWEHVNKANTSDGSKADDQDIWKSDVCSGIYAWASFYGNDGAAECIYSNGYSYQTIGPATPNLNALNGIGRIYGGNMLKNTFNRGGNFNSGLGTGLFAIRSGWDINSSGTGNGFRCAK